MKRMHILLMILILGSLNAGAQSIMPVGSVNFVGWQPQVYYFPSDANQPQRKWQLNTYYGLSGGMGFYNGAGTSFLSAPVGLQVTHPLSNHVYAFGAVSVAPTVFSFNNAFVNPSFNSYYPGNNFSNGFGVSSRVEMGLMYVNEARTFSISGSISVQHDNLPVYTQQQPVSTRRK